MPPSYSKLHLAASQEQDIAMSESEPEVENQEKGVTVVAVTCTNIQPTTPSTPPPPTKEAVQEEDSPAEEVAASRTLVDECSHEENLKRPLKYFTSEEDELQPLQLFPVTIYNMSDILYNTLLKMRAYQKRNVEAALKANKGIIKIPAHPHGKLKAFLCRTNMMQDLKEAPPPEADKSTLSTHKRDYRRHLVGRRNVFTEEKLNMLRAVLDAGWKREVVMRSEFNRGRKTGDVYYYPPQGRPKLRSSKQVEKLLAAHFRDSPFTVENFTFAKVRISDNSEREIVRGAYGGTYQLPRAVPEPVPSSSKETKVFAATATKAEAVESSKSSTINNNVSTRSSPDITVAHDKMDLMLERECTTGRWRLMVPPKRNSGGDQMLLPPTKRSKTTPEDKSNANKVITQNSPEVPRKVEDPSDCSKKIDIAKLVQKQQLAQRRTAQAALVLRGDTPQQGRTVAGATSKLERFIQVNTCSIRCIGHEGKVPNVQCERCLCLFHAGCLGFAPDNPRLNNYICSNCTSATDRKKSSSNAASTRNTTSISQQNMANMKDSGEVKKRSRQPRLAQKTHARRWKPVPGRKVVSVNAVYDGISGVMPPPIFNVISPSAPIIQPGRKITGVMMTPANSTYSQKLQGWTWRHPISFHPQGIPIPQQLLSNNLTVTRVSRFPAGAPSHVHNLPQPWQFLGGARPRQQIQISRPVPSTLMNPYPFCGLPGPSSYSSGQEMGVAPLPSSHHQGPSPALSASASIFNNPVVSGPASTQERSVASINHYPPQNVYHVGGQQVAVLAKTRAPDPHFYVPSTTAMLPAANDGEVTVIRFVDLTS